VNGWHAIAFFHQYNENKQQEYGGDVAIRCSWLLAFMRMVSSSDNESEQLPRRAGIMRECVMRREGLRTGRNELRAIQVQLVRGAVATGVQRVLANDPVGWCCSKRQNGSIATTEAA